MKRTRTVVSLLLFATCAFVVPSVRAGTACPDDPERCVERGAAVARTSGVATCATTQHGVSAPAAPVMVAATHKTTAAPAHRSAYKPAHATPLPASTTPATPGMGMLLKLSGGTGSDVSWYPSRPAENTGVSWVL